MPAGQSIPFSYMFDQFCGIASTPYEPVAGQFTDSRDVDIRESYPLLLPSRKPTSVFTSTKKMYCFVDKLAMGEDGKIYSLDNGANVKTTSAAEDIVSCIRYYDADDNDEYYVWLHGPRTGIQLGRISVDDASNATYASSRTGAASYEDDRVPTNRDTNRVTMPSGYGMKGKIVIFEGDLYVTNYNQIIVIDTTTGESEVGLSRLPAGIIGLSALGQMLRIDLENGDILYRNGDVNNSFQERMNIGYDLRGSYVKGNLSFMFGGRDGNKTEFFEMQGYGTKFLESYRNRFRLGSDDDTLQNLMCENNGLYYIAGFGGVYSYGSKSPKKPPAFNLDYSNSSGGYTYNAVTAIHVYNGDLYIGYRDNNSVIGVDRVDLDAASPTRYSTGRIITEVFDGGRGNRHRKKKINEITYYGYVGGSDTITLKINTDNFYTGDFTRKRIIDSDLYSDFAAFATIALANGNEQGELRGVDYDKEFYAMQMMIELTAGAKLAGILISGYIFE